MDSDDESTDPFYKPSLDKILNIIDERINSLVHLFQTENGIASLKWRMDTMYPKGLTDELRSLFGRDKPFQSCLYLLMNGTLMRPARNLTISLQNLIMDQQAQQAMDESLEMMHEGMIKSNNKRFKPTPKKINTTEKKKTGALDMFFKRKESN
ncbi:hypothetical protein CAS74_002193 [Pichia kudriavzevii]|uniref:Uncharacterized protein n=1 Tax=Pichia kudriavzevii TaxID=4909 RepID=A0A1Z8JPC2_PICKU|nr:hypothetical protein CAS74_002193 [Pichia kudriavzevii]